VGDELEEQLEEAEGWMISAIMDVLGTSTTKRMSRISMFGSLIYKLDAARVDSAKIKEGDKAIYINDKYSHFTAVLKKIYGELKSAKSYFKVFDVLVDMRGVDERCYCVYFGASCRVCLKKNIKYDLFDDVVDEGDEKTIAPQEDEGRDDGHGPADGHIQRRGRATLKKNNQATREVQQ
jgi:hypothetical protein